jgi:hypothetical protein
MRIQTYDIGTWLYPDSEITESKNNIVLDSVRNSDACFQILTDRVCEKGTSISWDLDAQCDDIKVTLSELRPVHVKYNSGAVNYNAIDWENVKDFVVRKAPYEVYDLTRPIDDGMLWGDTGYTAFFVQIDVDANAMVGKRKLVLSLRVGEEVARVKIELHVHTTVLCDAKDSPYPMGYWILSNPVCYIHNVERHSEEYFGFVENHLKMMANMRCNHIQLPTPIPVLDESGKIIDFDFSECDRITEIALRLGFRYINSGFVAVWKEWRDTKYYLRWDEDIEIESMEGYRQLRIYFQRTKEFIEKHNIENNYWQSFVDEPQLENSMAYKALAGTCRKFIPNVKIMDPVESPNVIGACDIWVVKQAVYEKYKEQYDELMAMGEELWVYTCGFPANKWMNHVIDLPLAATRLVVWEALKRGMNGFLHYGYHDYQEGMDTMYDTNWGRMFQKEMRYFPPGNHGVIYSDGKVIYDSVRAHVQRISAAEGELFLRLKEKDAEAVQEIIGGICTTFEEYVSDSVKIENARKALMERLDLYE